MSSLTTYGKKLGGLLLIAAVFAIIGALMRDTANAQADAYSDAGNGTHSSIMGD